MKTHAVVLAAGEARRMPNKALLPTKGKNLVIETALATAEIGFVDTLVVDKPDRLLTSILHRRGWDFRTIIQPHPAGVVDAIQRAACSGFPVEDRLVILFSDQVYENCSFPEMLGTNSYASVIRSEICGKYDWKKSGSDWMSRDKSIAREVDTFQGWLSIPVVTAQMFDPRECLVDVMNRFKFMPAKYVGDLHDAGTYESYSEYMS